jgi:quinol monooxygenase YgiN
MSVIVTLRINADPDRFAEGARADSERLGRIVEMSKQHGVIAHRWYATEGKCMVVDEWPDQESFQAFFNEAQGEIGPFMEATGVTDQPEVTFWSKLDLGDEIGWGA